MRYMLTNQRKYGGANQIITTPGLTDSSFKFYSGPHNYTNTVILVRLAMFEPTRSGVYRIFATATM